MNPIDYNRFESKAVLQEIILPFDTSVKLFIKRIDLVHRFISGNKWFKLKYNLIEAEQSGFDTLLTFGGAYSNHIHATAAAGKEYGFKTIGIIRGEVNHPLNTTLSFAEECGMRLVYLDRRTFREIHKKNFPEFLSEKFGRVYILPEGGSNHLAVKGCSEIMNEIDIDYNIICTACGTGGTIAGLIAGSNQTKEVLGFPALKGAEFLYDDINQLLTQTSGKSSNHLSVQSFNNSTVNWRLILDYHFGGYAKITRELVLFINNFEMKNKIRLDYIYTGKMMYGIYHLIQKGYFNENATIIAVHTGGLQGNAGMQTRINRLFN